jgi:hypothetical protein
MKKKFFTLFLTCASSVLVLPAGATLHIKWQETTVFLCSLSSFGRGGFLSHAHVTAGCPPQDAPASSSKPVHALSCACGTQLQRLELREGIWGLWGSGEWCESPTVALWHLAAVADDCERIRPGYGLGELCTVQLQFIYHLKKLCR